METKLVGDSVSNKIAIEMNIADFLKAMKIGQKGKVISIYASKRSYEETVKVDIEIETMDKLKQIDFTKTVEGKD